MKFPGSSTSTLVQSGRETSPLCEGSAAFFFPAFLSLHSQALPGHCPAATSPLLGCFISSLLSLAYAGPHRPAMPATDKHGSKRFSPNSSLDHKDQKVRQRFCSGTGYQQVNLHLTSNSFSGHIHHGWGRAEVLMCLSGIPGHVHSLPWG